MTTSYIPSIEQLYDCFHREYIHAVKGIWPRPIKNFDKILGDRNSRELLERFHRMISRNFGMIDWKIYIKACAETLKGRFKLAHLGTPAANRLYRQYVDLQLASPADQERVFDSVVSSLKFVQSFCEQESIGFAEYFSFGGALPVSLRHFGAGTLSPYFFGLFDELKLRRWMKDVEEEAFQDSFSLTKEQFFAVHCRARRFEILKIPKVKALAEALEKRLPE